MGSFLGHPMFLSSPMISDTAAKAGGQFSNNLLVLHRRCRPRSAGTRIVRPPCSNKWPKRFIYLRRLLLTGADCNRFAVASRFRFTRFDVSTFQFQPVLQCLQQNSLLFTPQHITHPPPPSHHHATIRHQPMGHDLCLGSCPIATNHQSPPPTRAPLQTMNNNLLFVPWYTSRFHTYVRTNVRLYDETTSEYNTWYLVHSSILLCIRTVYRTPKKKLESCSRLGFLFFNIK